MKLNWGCGSIPTPEGWVGSDIVDYGQKDVGDIREGLPWNKATFDLILANHSLCALMPDDVPIALAELHRVLKPSGRLRIILPDIIGAFEAWQSGNLDWFPNNREPTISERLVGYLNWYGTNPSLFTRTTIQAALHRAGFARVESPGEPTELDDREAESIILDALKR